MSYFKSIPLFLLTFTPGASIAFATTNCPSDHPFGSGNASGTSTICINNVIQKDDAGKELNEVLIENTSISYIYDSDRKLTPSGRMIYMEGSDKKLTLDNVDLHYEYGKNDGSASNQQAVVLNDGASLFIRGGKYTVQLTHPNTVYVTGSAAFALDDSYLEIDGMEISADYNNQNARLKSGTVFQLSKNSEVIVNNAKITSNNYLGDVVSSKLVLNNTDASYKERLFLQSGTVNTKGSNLISDKDTFLLYKGNNALNIVDTNVNSGNYVFNAYGAGGVSDINISGQSNVIGAGLMIVSPTAASNAGQVIANLDISQGAYAKGEVKTRYKKGFDESIANVALSNGAFWQGNAISERGTSIDISLQSNSIWQGRTTFKESDSVVASDTSNINVKLENGHWKITNDSQLTSLSLLNNSTVLFDNATKNIRLDTERLDGDGTGIITMSAIDNAGDISGDFLSVSDAVTGSFNVDILDSGYELKSANKRTIQGLMMIDARGSTSDSFKLVGGAVDIGAHRYDLTYDGNDAWYLTQNDALGPSENTRAVLAIANVLPVVWESELTTLRNRMGDIRHDSDNNGNVWASYLTNRYRVSSGYTAYRNDMNGLMVGGDKVYSLLDSTLLVGGLASFSYSDVKYNRAGGGSVDSYGLGAYLTWLDNSGYYLSTVLKHNWYQVDNNAKTLDGTDARGNYSATSLGLSLEGGKTFEVGKGFIEPYLMLSAMRTSSENYQLSNGLEANTGRAKSLKGELGARVGYNLNTAAGSDMQLYLRLAASHEFNDKNTVTINRSERFNTDMSGTTGNYGVGINGQFDKDWSVYAEINYLNGKHIESPYSGNIGIRYSF